MKYRTKYSSDLTTKQWNSIKHLFEKEKRGSHFRTHSKRKLVDTVLYLNKTVCQWRQLPKGFPKWQTVHSFYSRACANGLWEKTLRLLVKKAEKPLDENPNPPTLSSLLRKPHLRCARLLAGTPSSTPEV